MAARSPTTSDVASSITGRQSDISALFALRAGLVALAEECEAPSVDDESLTRALDELWRLDNEILGIQPRTVAHLRMQGAVCRHYTNIDGFAPEEPLLSRLLLNLDKMRIDLS